MLNRKLLVCSNGNYYVLNSKLLCAQLEIVGVLNGKLFWVLHGMHMVVVVNYIPNVKSAVIHMPFKSTLPYQFDVWLLHGRLE